ncbi:MAG: hypothetical protein RRA35_10820 [Desulfomonilia bacterium]|nr:hypothetical protein [Desulfomonilia bacterium]
MVKEHEFGALLVTGPEKIRCGYGNGDCLLIDLKNAFFALSDSAERYSRASRDILERLCDLVKERGVPEQNDEWLHVVNSVFAAQKYQHKATFSLAAIRQTGGGSSICIINGGDSEVAIVNKATKRVEYRTEPNMNFAGRSKGISGVMEVSLQRDQYRLVMASDGLADIARFCGEQVTDLVESFLSHGPVHEIPEKLRDLIISAVSQGIAGNYDDIGVIVIDPEAVKRNTDVQLVMGGTNPSEEDAYQKDIRSSHLDGGWISMESLPENAHYVAKCGIRIR